MKRDISVVGMDIAKHVFHVIGMDKQGTIILRQRLYRGEVMSFMAQLPRAIGGMEACGGAHSWARQLRQQGPQVRLMAPQDVKPDVKTNKNDRRDAEAMAEAVTRPNRRFVPVKDAAQQDIQALHRVRERLVTAHTALVNEMRGLLAEYGMVLPQGVAKFRKTLVSALAAEPTTLTPLGQELFHKLFDELGRLEAALAYSQKTLEALAHSHPVCQRLFTMPGLGPLTATALSAAVGEGQGFKNGRQFAAWLGLVPKQYSTGGQTRLLGISKRGDRYLRPLLSHGARATLRWARARADRRSPWIRGVWERRGWNRTAVAVANKKARIVWALLRRGGVYRESGSEHRTQRLWDER